MKLAEKWMEAAPEGFKVIVHVGSTCVKSSRNLAEHAQKIGAWGIGAMATPFPRIGRIEDGKVLRGDRLRRSCLTVLLLSYPCV